MKVVESYLSAKKWHAQREYGDVRSRPADMPHPARGQWVLRGPTGAIVCISPEMRYFFEHFADDTGELVEMFDIPEGMRRWVGGPQAPADWDLMSVKFRNGKIASGRDLGKLDWGHPQAHATTEMPSDIIAFGVRLLSKSEGDDTRQVGFYWVMTALDMNAEASWMNDHQPAYWNGHRWFLLGIEEPFPVLMVGPSISHDFKVTSAQWKPSNIS